MVASANQTPLRARTAVDDDGVRVIRDPHSSWQDGSEPVLLERMRSGLPLDSLSDELEATATSWPERYHLATARANFLRALDLPPDARVLEVGAGCGAITRYLGEQCALVDAVEPTLVRGKVAAARTAELPGVTVFCCELSDVPEEEAYDLVVVVGVLEYVGDGGRDLAPYLEFLAKLQRVLVPGGSLVLAIENPLGVKYLAGAPEDHSGIVFHSVEGYPEDGPARTFSRTELASLHTQAGFGTPRVLGAFPDYKLTRFVLDERVLSDAPDFSVAIPRFPSPDWVIPRPSLIDEGLLWNELVQAGVGIDFANSFVVVAPKADASHEIWVDGRLGSYLSLHRRHEFMVINHIECAGEDIHVRTQRLGTGEADGLRVEEAVTKLWSPAESAVTKAAGSMEALEQVLVDYQRLVEELVVDGDDVRFDLLPHNLVYTDGEVHPVDDEWRSSRITTEEVRDRAILLFSRALLAETGPQSWGLSTPRELIELVARRLGVTVDEGWLDAVLGREADLQVVVASGAPASESGRELRQRVLDGLRADLSTETMRRRAVKHEEMTSVMRLDALTARQELAAAKLRLEELNQEYNDLGARAHEIRVERDTAQSALDWARAKPWRHAVRSLLRR